jgi:hypothetical protein
MIQFAEAEPVMTSGQQHADLVAGDKWQVGAAADASGKD